MTETNSAQVNSEVAGEGPPGPDDERVSEVQWDLVCSRLRNPPYHAMCWANQNGNIQKYVRTAHFSFE